MSNRLAVTLCTSLPRVFYSPSLVTLSHSLSSCHSVYRLVVAQPYTNARRPLSIATVVRIQSFTNTCILSHQVCRKDCSVSIDCINDAGTHTLLHTYTHSRARYVSHSLSSQPFVTCIKSFNRSYHLVSHLLAIRHDAYALVVAQAYTLTSFVINR